MLGFLFFTEASFSAPAIHLLTSNIDATLAVARKYKATVFIAGFGDSGQYKNVEEAERALNVRAIELDRRYGEGNWLAVYGGDTYIKDAPNVSHLLKFLHEKHHTPVLSIRTYGNSKHEVDDFVDYYQETYTMVNVKPQNPSHGDETQIEVERFYGGHYRPNDPAYASLEGELTGPSRIYLSEPFTGGDAPLLKEMIVIGGNSITLEEAKFIQEKKIPITYIKAEAKYPKEGLPFGLVDQWFSKNPSPNCYRELVESFIPQK